MTALANALRKALGEQENQNLPQPKYVMKNGRLEIDDPHQRVHDQAEPEEEPGVIDDPHYYGYDDFTLCWDAEDQWEEGRRIHREYEQSQKLIPWSIQGTCDQHRDLMLPLMAEKGYTLLAHGWNSTDDGFPYHVGWYKYAHHQSLMFQAPGNAALAFILTYTHQIDGEGETHRFGVNVLGEVTDNKASGCHRGVVLIRGCRGLSSSWGGSETNRCSHAQGFEPHWSDSRMLPDPADLVASIHEAYLSVKAITPQAPLTSYAYIGNNIDNSYVFPKSPSFDLFWERAGGRERVQAFAPKASFTKAYVLRDGSLSYY